MYATVMSGEIRPEQLDDAVTFFQSQIVPALRALPGFHDAYMLTDKAGSLLLVSIWESKQAAEASERDNRLQDLYRQFLHFTFGTPLWEDYDVSVEARKAA